MFSTSQQEKNGFSSDTGSISTNERATVVTKTEIDREQNKVLSKFCPVVDNNSVAGCLSSFELLKVIGRGTFGKVILIRNKEEEKYYALKCLKKFHILKTNNVENLKNEKKILSRLDNPFIIKLHKTFQDKEKIYMLFDYYNGGELFFHLQKLKRFTEDMIKFYAAEIYIALQYLHKKNIIYRDLKPENIILDEEGHVKLIDFGLARELGFRSVTSTFCGTNEYIPPEVVEGKKYSDNFDWWCYGVLIYEMFFGRPPFMDKNKAALFKKICFSEPNYSKVKLSPEALSLLKALLNKNPDKRIKSKDIALHPFFKGIDFKEIEKLTIKPPYKPEVKNIEDLANIDPCFLNEDVYSPARKIRVDYDQSKFNDF